MNPQPSYRLRMLVARITVRHKGCVTETITGSLRGVQIGERDGSHLLLLSAPDASGLQSLLGRFEKATGRAPQLLHRAPQQALVLGRTSDKCVTRALAAHGCSVVWPAWYQDGQEAFTVLAARREQLDQAVRAVSPPNDVHIDSIEPVRGQALPVSFTVGDVLGKLTKRQLEILHAAIEMGYYATPRRATNEDLAARFGLSPSTLKEHLRKAEHHLMGSFGQLVLAQSWLLDAGRPGRGRRRAPAQGRDFPSEVR